MNLDEITNLASMHLRTAVAAMEQNYIYKADIQMALENICEALDYIQEAMNELKK